MKNSVPVRLKNHGPVPIKGARPMGKETRIPRKCLLPSCNVMHTHNGGYCCAAHHREAQYARVNNLRIVANHSSISP